MSVDGEPMRRILPVECLTGSSTSPLLPFCRLARDAFPGRDDAWRQFRQESARLQLLKHAPQVADRTHAHRLPVESTRQFVEQDLRKLGIRGQQGRGDGSLFREKRSRIDPFPTTSRWLLDQAMQA
ncbi:MAG: hypothetical protein AB7F99_19820 [Vicinamibacterales bacterium]